MPLYEFHCLDCDTQFEELVFSQTELPSCPHCSSPKTEKLISRPCRNKNSSSGADIPSMPPAAVRAVQAALARLAGINI